MLHFPILCINYMLQSLWLHQVNCIIGWWDNVQYGSLDLVTICYLQLVHIFDVHLETYPIPSVVEQGLGKLPFIWSAVALGTNWVSITFIILYPIFLLHRGWFNTCPCCNALTQPSMCPVLRSTCPLHVTLHTKCEFLPLWFVKPYFHH